MIGGLKLAPNIVFSTIKEKDSKYGCTISTILPKKYLKKFCSVERKIKIKLIENSGLPRMCTSSHCCCSSLDKIVKLQG